MNAEFAIRAGHENVTINTCSSVSLLSKVRERLAVGQGFAIATLNLDHIVKMRRSGRFRRAYLRQDIIVADGNPVVWLSRLANQPVELVTGADMVLPLARLAAETETPIALLGSTEAVLERAGSVLEAEVPGLVVSATIGPPHPFDPEGPLADEMIARLAASGAGFVFLALGAPKQELFAAHCRNALPSMGFASIGAGLDFLAGHQRRAPRLMRRLALEWLWRMASNPRRLARRYAQCALLLPFLALQVLVHRLGLSSGGNGPLRPPRSVSPPIVAKRAKI